ncbi:MAG TPA: ABC transporter substrate-binding protein [Gemmataceae bacterium]|jgi:putative ABC transport system substrate-binding protein|nr:ABC transporter substrate-binding protein [Gemmataceae bacterium]
MRRRKFITLVGAAAATWPLAARAQQATMPVVRWLSARSPSEAASVLQAFRQGLGQVGYFEGKNVTIEYRWAEGRYDRLPALAAELVNRQVTVIAATGGEPSPLAAKAATTTIPIVFTIGGDPVETGLVASFGRPGGNLTGTTIMAVEMTSKRLDLARQLVPNISAIAMLINPKFPPAATEAREAQSAARPLGIHINLLYASTESEIAAAFTTIVEQRSGALIVGADPFLLGQREQLVRLATQHRVPTIYFLREFVEAGGLVSYGPNIANGYRQTGVYTGLILNGAKPTDLPVVRPTQFLLCLNVRTAKALGLEISPLVLALADEVIE